MAILKRKLDAGQYNLKDQVVSINRVTKVVKGGKNMSFAALVVVGDPGAGVVGFGSGKAKEVPQAIRKGIEAAKKNLVRINLTDTTIPHQVLGRFGAGPCAAQTGSGRHGSDRRRRCARGDDLGRRAERVDQEPWHRPIRTTWSRRPSMRWFNCATVAKWRPFAASRYRSYSHGRCRKQERGRSQKVRPLFFFSTTGLRSRRRRSTRR